MTFKIDLRDPNMWRVAESSKEILRGEAIKKLLPSPFAVYGI